MQEIAIKTGKRNAHPPMTGMACSAVSMATETCMLGKQLLDWSNFCTNCKNHSDGVLPGLMLRQCGGVETGNSQKNSICINSRTKKLKAIMLKWWWSVAIRLR